MTEENKAVRLNEVKEAEALEQRLKALEAEMKKVKAKQSDSKRKAENRAKIMVGAVVMKARGLTAEDIHLDPANKNQLDAETMKKLKLDQPAVDPADHELAEAIRAFAGKEVSAEAIRRIANVYPVGKSPDVDKLRQSFMVPIRQVNAVPIPQPQPQSQSNQQVPPIFKR